MGKRFGFITIFKPITKLVYSSFFAFLIHFIDLLFLIIYRWKVMLINLTRELLWPLSMFMYQKNVYREKENRWRKERERKITIDN